MRLERGDLVAPPEPAEPMVDEWDAGGGSTPPTRYGLGHGTSAATGYQAHDG